MLVPVHPLSLSPPLSLLLSSNPRKPHSYPIVFVDVFDSNAINSRSNVVPSPFFDKRCLDNARFFFTSSVVQHRRYEHLIDCKERRPVRVVSITAQRSSITSLSRKAGRRRILRDSWPFSHAQIDALFFSRKQAKGTRGTRAAKASHEPAPRCIRPPSLSVTCHIIFAR